MRRVALALGGLVVIGYPWLGTLAGRPLAQAEVAGWMPDPTAWATLAWMLALTHRAAWQRAPLTVLPVGFAAAGLFHHATMAL